MAAAKIDLSVETLGPCRKKVSVRINPERIQEEYDKQYGEINENYALPGFRKGRAPRRLLERRFGGRLADEVKGELLKAALAHLVEEKKVEPLAPPSVDLAAAALDPTKDFVVEFELVTRPEFATPAWKGIEAKVPHPTVEESEVDRMVDELRRRRARLLTAEDAVVTEGDVLVVDWEARDGESVEAKDGGVYYPFGRGVIAGFVAEGLDDALRGAKAGAVATATVRVAVDDPREELRGRDLSLVVTLKEVKRYLLPALDADFLKALDYDDEKEMREDLRKRILRGKQRDTERLAEERLVEALLGQVEISLPEQFVERELQHWANRKRMEGEVEGIAEEVVTRGIDAARADARLHIERDMRRHFLLDRIAAEEGIEVTEAEIVEAIESIASAYGRPVEEVIDSFRDGGRLAELRSQVRHRKAREALRRHAKLVEEAPAAS